MIRLLKKTTAVCMAMILFLIPVAGCSEDEEKTKPADYGTYGADFAREFASSYPFRKAFSSQEASAGDMIEEELTELGYDVEKQTFTAEGGSSSNYIVRIEGQGFVDETDDGDLVDVRKTVVIGAHYDSSFSAEELVDGNETYGYDGISDNASGVGCLMTVAKQIADYKDIGFDVILVFFGAGNADYAGARAFFSSLTEEEQSDIEVMYCIDSIYAGDKVYASSGFNSLIPDQKYQMRRKLYQAYDVVYDSELASINGFTLLYNESNIVTDVNGDEVPDVYREVSVNKSDYVIFDDAGIPIVYFDSADYFFPSLEEMKETKNLNLQAFGGAVRGTPLDSSSYLDPVLNTEEKDILVIRINNIAYTILESMRKGSDYGMTQEQYEQMLRDRTADTDPSVETSATSETTSLAPVIPSDTEIAAEETASEEAPSEVEG